MADGEEQAKAEKLAAAKKRFEQLKKQKGKKGGTKKDVKKADPQAEIQEESAKTDEAGKDDIPPGESGTKAQDDEGQGTEEAIEAPDASGSPPPTVKPSHARAPSLSIQSQLRSSSFRQSSGLPSGGPQSPGLKSSNPLVSPEGEAVTEIYRKQAFRIEELERENKKLARDYGEADKRWRKADEELEELREAKGDVANLKSTAEKGKEAQAEVEKLKAELSALQRQNAHLTSTRPRHASNASPLHSSKDNPSSTSPSSLAAELASKSSTIESMELEISNLRAALSKAANPTTPPADQDSSALQTRLESTAALLSSTQTELAKLKESLSRTSDRAVKESTLRTSAETALATLRREHESTKAEVSSQRARADAQETKVATLTRLSKDSGDLRARLNAAEKERDRLREKVKTAEGGETAAGLEELEEEERDKLRARVRELEGALDEMRRKEWREKRAELQASGTRGRPGAAGLGSPGGTDSFDDVDLSAPSPGTRNIAGAKGPANRPKGVMGVLGSGFAAALTGGDDEQVGGFGGADDEDDFFDEDAFSRAREEEEERIRERRKSIERRLEGWRGWRLDLVDSRRAGGAGLGTGEIFEV